MQRTARLVAILLLAACSSTTTIPTTSTTLDEGWFIYEGPPSTLGAELTGSIVIDLDARCIQVGDDQAVFPGGTKLDLSDPERPSLVLPNGHRVHSGGMVELGGGGVRPPVAGRAEGCGVGRPFAVGY